MSTKAVTNSTSSRAMVKAPGSVYERSGSNFHSSGAGGKSRFQPTTIKASLLADMLDLAVPYSLPGQTLLFPSDRSLLSGMDLLQQLTAALGDRYRVEREPVSYTHLTLPTTERV